MMRARGQRQHQRLRGEQRGPDEGGGASEGRGCLQRMLAEHCRRVSSHCLTRCSGLWHVPVVAVKPWLVLIPAVQPSAPCASALSCRPDDCVTIGLSAPSGPAHDQCVAKPECSPPVRCICRSIAERCTALSDRGNWESEKSLQQRFAVRGESEERGHRNREGQGGKGSEGAQGGRKRKEKL